VHHFDENKRNNEPSNLVICQDRGYHLLLHIRQRTMKSGGDPNTERVCSRCSKVLPMAAFRAYRHVKADGRSSRCVDCLNECQAQWRAARQ
jgi:hypothetical protein